MEWDGIEGDGIECDVMWHNVLYLDVVEQARRDDLVLEPEHHRRRAQREPVLWTRSSS